MSRPDGVTGFTPLPERWLVERTFAWLGQSRALAEGYERTAAAGEVWVKWSGMRLMLRRLKTYMQYGFQEIAAGGGASGSYFLESV